jgi:hypothetical protein
MYYVNVPIAKTDLNAMQASAVPGDLTCAGVNRNRQRQMRAFEHRRIVRDNNIAGDGRSAATIGEALDSLQLPWSAKSA